LVAGLLLLGWCCLRGEPLPRAIHWRSALVIGFLLCTASNGLVVWSELRVPSGLAALMVATVPLWMWIGEVVFEQRPAGGPRLYTGLVLGTLGVVALAGPGLGALGGAIDPWGALALILSPITWTLGSLLSRRMPQARSSLQASALQMVCGGGLLAAGALIFEAPFEHLAEGPTLRASACLLYLCLFGSLVCLSAYGWLLRHVAPTRVATYAYVNPVVAMAVGTWLADEPFGWRAGLATALILAAVLLVLSRPRAPAR
jgi:drug/metabolite transporter (DMT)-like permease